MSSWTFLGSILGKQRWKLRRVKRRRGQREDWKTWPCPNFYTFTRQRTFTKSLTSHQTWKVCWSISISAYSNSFWFIANDLLFLELIIVYFMVENFALYRDKKHISFTCTGEGMRFRPMQSWHRKISIVISLRSDSPLVVIVEDLNLPLSLQCGGFQNFIQTVVLWFSSGGTKSHLHRDMLDNINCLLDGKKEIIFIDKVRFIVHLYCYESWIPLRAVKEDGLVVDFYPT